MGATINIVQRLQQRNAVLQSRISDLEHQLSMLDDESFQLLVGTIKAASPQSAASRISIVGRARQLVALALRLARQALQPEFDWLVPSGPLR